MKYNPDIHHRKSVRLKEYDYSNAGAYYVTICVKNKECLLGSIHQGEMVLNEYGNVANKFWEWLSKQYVHVSLDEFIVMPNHLHGIIVINDDCRGEVSSPLLKTDNYIKMGGVIPPLRKRTLGQIIGYFKYQTTKQINIIRNTPGFPIWQRNYYEHVIRNERELNAIREYIIYNPMKWDEDEYNTL
jgi:putative transposase